MKRTCKRLGSKGLEICNELNNQEYKHHFTILKTQHTGILDDLENAIIAGTTYFNSKNYTIMYKNITNY